MIVDLNDAGAPLMPARSRVIDPVLTSASVGYRHPRHVWPAIAPRVRTMARGGKLVEFDETSLLKVDTRRSPGGNMQLIGFGHEGKPFALTNHALGGLVPVESQEDAEAEPGINLGMNAVEGVQKILSLAREIETAELVTDSTNYDATNTVTLGGNSRWDTATGDPAKNVATGIEVIRQACGIRPNTAIVPGVVMSVLQYHPNLIDAVKRGGMPRSRANAEDVAAWWGLEHVEVADAIYASPGGAKSDVWGKHVVLAYTELGSMTMPEPTFAYSYTLSGAGMAEQPFYLPERRSWVYPVVEDWSIDVVFKAAGYLLKSVID